MARLHFLDKMLSQKPRPAQDLGAQKRGLFRDHTVTELRLETRVPVPSSVCRRMLRRFQTSGLDLMGLLGASLLSSSCFFSMRCPGIWVQLGKGSRPLQQVWGAPVFTNQPSLLTKGG